MNAAEIRAKYAMDAVQGNAKKWRYTLAIHGPKDPANPNPPKDLTVVGKKRIAVDKIAHDLSDAEILALVKNATGKDWYTASFDSMGGSALIVVNKKYKGLPGMGGFSGSRSV